jgi:2-phosphoglycolate phosphatase
MRKSTLQSCPRAILFDLDGTLADTAPDLAAAANRLRRVRGMESRPFSMLRPVASSGARGMLAVAFGLTPRDETYEAMRKEFLDSYYSKLVVESRLFDGIADLLAGLEQTGLTWGIVTNKASRYTDPLLPQIGLQHAPCVVCGDTTPHTKPHPAPLLEAARRLGVEPEHCWYVGDDLRDIEAGRAAGMRTVAITWGYCGTSQPHSWGADMLAATPQGLLNSLRKLSRAAAAKKPVQTDSTS